MMTHVASPLDTTQSKEPQLSLVGDPLTALAGTVKTKTDCQPFKLSLNHQLLKLERGSLILAGNLT